MKLTYKYLGGATPHWIPNSCGILSK